ASTSGADYVTPNVALPAGTYFVRIERDYTSSGQTPNTFTVNNLAVNTVSGPAATFSNASSDANALAAADTYIANYRRGSAAVALAGVAAGTQFNVDLSKLAFNFGNAIPGGSQTGVNSYLGSTGTTQQAKYQQALNQNFNSITPE